MPLRDFRGCIILKDGMARQDLPGLQGLLDFHFRECSDDLDYEESPLQVVQIFGSEERNGRRTAFCEVLATKKDFRIVMGCLIIYYEDFRDDFMVDFRSLNESMEL